MNLKLLSAVALVSACAVAPAVGQVPNAPSAPTPSGQAEQPGTATGAAASEAARTSVPISPCCKIPALTPIELEFVDPASSRTSKSGDLVSLRLAEPLIIDGHTVAPAGTRAVAEVIQASKSGLMGKAGELTFAARYVEVGSTRIPLKRFGYGRSQGKDPSGTLNALNVAAAVTVPIASVALIFVSGGNVDIKSGAPAHAVVATETFVPSNL